MMTNIEEMSRFIASYRSPNIYYEDNEEESKHKYMVDIVEIEFPAIEKHDGFYTLDLSRKLSHNVYKKSFIESYLAEILTYGNFNKKEICHAEYWIILNNSKYNYLHKFKSVSIDEL